MTNRKDNVFRCLLKNYCIQGSICETRKGPNRPPPWFQGEFSLLYMPVFPKTVTRHIYRPRPFIWAYSQVSTTIRYKEKAWKCSCLEKTPFYDILAEFYCQKAHLQAKTFHMSLFRGLYDHPLQRYSLEKLVSRKTAVFGHFGQILPFPVAETGQTVKRHIYTPRLSYDHIPRSLEPSVTKKQSGKKLISKNHWHFIWAYNKVSMT